MMRNILALIPARAGSKGVPNKNVKNIGGHPLMEWSIKACQKSKLIDRVIVSTDSQEYANLAISFGAEAPFLRPEAISGDQSTDLDFVNHALNWLAHHRAEPEYIVHIRPTTPFRDPALIDEAIELFLENKEMTSLRSIHEMSESAYKTFEISDRGILKRVGANSSDLDLANNARQSFPKTYFANGYVDVLRVSFIREQGLLHGDKVFPYITPPVLEVDTDEDFEHLEFQLNKDHHLLQRLFK